MSDRLGIYRHGDSITERNAIALLNLPGSNGWGIAQVGHDIHALQVICVDLATYAERIACVTWDLKHYDKLPWKVA